VKTQFIDNYFTEISRLKLKSLDFSCNKIQTVPLEYRFMETLEELVLENNPLVNPPASVSTTLLITNIYIYIYIDIDIYVCVRVCACARARVCVTTAPVYYQLIYVLLRPVYPNN